MNYIAHTNTHARAHALIHLHTLTCRARRRVVIQISQNDKVVLFSHTGKCKNRLFRSSIIFLCPVRRGSSLQAGVRDCCCRSVVSTATTAATPAPPPPLCADERVGLNQLVDREIGLESPDGYLLSFSVSRDK